MAQPIQQQTTTRISTQTSPACLATVAAILQAALRRQQAVGGG